MEDRQRMERRWQAARTGREPAPKHVFPRGSLGEAFERFRRTETWKAKKPRTREDWERGWSHISPIFGDVAPRTVTFEHVDAWYHALKTAKSVQEAHRAMKIWRALWQVSASMRYCTADEDPSFGIRRETPKGRSETWSEGEVSASSRRPGGAAIAASLASSQWPTTRSSPRSTRDRCGLRTAAATARSSGSTSSGPRLVEEPWEHCPRRTQALVRAYVAMLPADFLPSAPIFLTSARGGL